VNEVDLHSRSRLAGYQPELLFNAVVLIVGAGALGQNLALDLALAGVGELEIVDFDSFEAHNATRSPLYPTAAEQARWGCEKAPVVSRKLLPLMTAPSPRIRYAAAPIQSLGELPLLRAQIVFSAVDNLAARAYLTERCHLLHRPLIEGGFHGEMMNLTVFGPQSHEPCYRCLNPRKSGAFSCTQYALQAEAQHIIPAIQNTATALAGFQAEAGIQWLHGEQFLRNKAVYVNIREMKMRAVEISKDPDCPGIHWEHFNEPLPLGVAADQHLAHLLAAAEGLVGPATLRFPDPVVVRIGCTRCGTVVDAFVPEWAWLRSPRCTACGGPFKHAASGASLESKEYIHTREQHELLSYPCAALGMPAGAVVEIWPDTPHPTFGPLCLVQLQGTIQQVMHMA